LLQTGEEQNGLFRWWMFLARSMVFDVGLLATGRSIRQYSLLHLAECWLGVLMLTFSSLPVLNL